MLLLIKAHFSDANNFGFFKDELECMVYDNEETKLAIKLDYLPDSKNPSPRPAIYVSLAQVRFDKKALNNLAGWSEDNATMHQAKLQGTVFNITSIADSVDVALMMSETISDFFAGIRSHLMSTLGISYFEVDGISAPRLREKQPESYFEVDVEISMMFSFVMSANIESHRLKKFALDIEPS